MRLLKMTKKLLTIFAAGAIIFIVNEHIIASSIQKTTDEKLKPMTEINDKPDEIVVKKTKEPNLNDKEWVIFIDAIINIESGGNDTISGPTNDLGCIQATPIYVEDANRICKLKGINKTYTHEDRKSRRKSIEMFNIIQSHYNKPRCIETAARLHNPGAGQPYIDKVINEYKRLKQLKSNKSQSI